MKYTEQIRLEIETICAEHGVPTPKTVASAAKLIMEWRGHVRARELFAGAARETAADPFKSSAYQATLQTIIK